MKPKKAEKNLSLTFKSSFLGTAILKFLKTSFGLNKTAILKFKNGLKVDLVETSMVPSRLLKIVKKPLKRSCRESEFRKLH